MHAVYSLLFAHPPPRENNVATATALTDPEKRDPSVMHLKWVLIYSHTVRRWRLACVTDASLLAPNSPAIVTVRWWRLDQKWAKSQMLDISTSLILAATVYPEGAVDVLVRQLACKGRERDYAPTGKGRKRTRESDGEEGEEGRVIAHQRASLTTADGRRRRRRRRMPDGSLAFRDDLSDEAGRGGPALGRGRGKGRGRGRWRAAQTMLMDGVDDGAVPPGVLLAASGVGGVGGLHWTDDDGSDHRYGRPDPAQRGRGRGRGRGSRGGRGAYGRRPAKPGYAYEDDESPEEPPASGSMSDTYVSAQSLQAAKCAAGAACRAVDIAMCGENTNVFVCTRPPGHHAGRYGCTGGCLSTGFCLLNNAAIAAVYGRVRWGLERVAVVDIDVHFGNGTAELLRGDPSAFFASVHMIYGEGNDGSTGEGEGDSGDEGRMGFYPALLGVTEVTDNYVSVGVYPPEGPGRLLGRSVSSASGGGGVGGVGGGVGGVGGVGGGGGGGGEEVDVTGMEVEGETAPTATATATATTTTTTTTTATATTRTSIGNSRKTGPGAGSFFGTAGFRRALSDVIIPQLEKFSPELLIISAGFDGYHSDPIGGELQLSAADYVWCTERLVEAMDRVARAGGGRGRVVSLLEGGYDTKPQTLGLAKCVDSHVRALRNGGL